MFREVQLVNNFQRRYDVTVGRQTRVISLTFDAYSPKLAADVANAVSSEYIDWSMENRLQGVTQAKDFLSKRVKEADANLKSAQAEYQQYLAEHKIISAEDNGNITVDRASELNRQLVEVQNDRRTAEAVFNRSREVAADELPQVINDATVQNLSQGLSRKKQELANLSAKYQPAFPQVKQVQEEVKQLETQLTEHKAKLIKNIESQFQVARKARRRPESRSGTVEERSDSAEPRIGGTEFEEAKGRDESQDVRRPARTLAASRGRKRLSSHQTSALCRMPKFPLRRSNPTRFSTSA